MAKNKITVNSSTNLIDAFVLLIGLGSSSLWVSWLIFAKSNPNETTDKLLALSVGITCFIVGIRLLGSRISEYVVKVFSVVAIFTLMTGIAILEHKEMSKEHPMGFGTGVALLTLVLAVLIPYAMNLIVKRNKIINTVLWVFGILVSTLVGLAFFQTRTTLLEPGHSEYVLNEMMAPAAGNNPYQDFVPQYAFLASWFIVPIYKIFDVVTATDILVIIFCIGGFASILISLFLARKVYQNGTFAFALLFILPFSTPTPGWNRFSFIGPASTLLSGPALRILGGMLVGLFGVIVATRIWERKSKKWETFAVGALSAAVFWNNFDFGAAALLAIVLTYFFLTIFIKEQFAGKLIHLLAGVVIGWFGVYLSLILVGGAPDWSLFAWFARQFGGGFGSVTIEIPGPVLMAFPVIMGTATFGIYAIKKFKKDSNDDLNIWAPLVATYFGMWSTFSLPYYINRSYHAGQMSMLYVPLSLALFAAISINWKSINYKFEWRRTTHIFLALVTAFPIATVLLIPNPSIELKRLNGGNPDSTFPRAPMQQAIDAYPEVEKMAKEQKLTLGYFGEGGNYVQMLTGAKSVNIFNSPLDMFQSNASVQLSCEHLIKNGTQILLLTESAKMTFAWKDGSLCDGLYRITAENPNLAIRQK